MSDPLRDQNAGEGSRFVTSLPTVNAVLEAARAYRRERFGRRGAGAEGDPVPGQLTVRVRNDTGSSLPAFSVVKLGTPLVSATDKPYNFRAAPVFPGTAPSADTDTVAITHEPIKPGKLGRACVLGVMPVDVSVSDTTHTCAKPSPGNALVMDSATSGPARIIDKAAGTGTLRAVVLLGRDTGSGGGGGGYDRVQEEGSNLTQRTTLNFIGDSVTAEDDPGNTRTNVTVTAYNRVQEEGSDLTQRPTLNFLGTYVTAADDPGNNRTNVTVSVPPVVAYDTVEEEGSALPQRPTINFLGTYVTAADDAANNRTNVTVSVPPPLASPLTTKGDLWGYDTTDNRVPIGTDGYVLTADSTQVLGLKWAPASGGFTPTHSFSSAAAFNPSSTSMADTGAGISLPAAGVYLLTASARGWVRASAFGSSSAGVGIRVQLYNDTAAAYLSNATLRDVCHSHVANRADYGSAQIVYPFTAGGATTIKVHAARFDPSGGLSTFTGASLEEVFIGYLRLS